MCGSSLTRCLLPLRRSCRDGRRSPMTTKTNTTATDTCAQGHVLEEIDTQALLPFSELAYVAPVCGICERTAAISAKAAKASRSLKDARNAYAVPIEDLKVGVDTCPREGCHCQLIETHDRLDPIRGMQCGWRPLAKLSPTPAVEMISKPGLKRKIK